ncbi:hypothetical protein HHI36_002432 [Cryptolaemus montrouzieri]|uniref:Uncharacterized protein n=1 Tax=Cryptolaemus montrouzieri TaxID=559131 RepID=A0ABD2PAZ3_9CUCU
MSMYRFVKDNNSSGASKRLFVQGTSGNPNTLLGPPVVSLTNPNNVESLQAVYTKKHLSTEVLGSSIESTKTSRRNEDGTRRITTRIVRKVTTLTRGEENSNLEDLTRRASVKSIEASEGVAGAHQGSYRAVKRVKVRELLKNIV